MTLQGGWTMPVSGKSLKKLSRSLFVPWVGLFCLAFCLSSEVAADKLFFYRFGVFHIAYSLQGEDAVAPDDMNTNGIPDQVENIAVQLMAAREVFHDVLGFPDPLSSEHYSQTEGVIVWLRSRSRMRGNRGLAFSVASPSRHFSGKWLKLQISTDINPRRNPTPAHEYFHLIQYSQANFKNAWYLEGMARWSEDLVQRVPVARKKNDLSPEKIWESKYRANDMLWRPLAETCGRRAGISPELLQKYHYVDGSPVFHDAWVSGPQVMVDILFCLKRKEKEAAASEDLEVWRKKQQRNPANNPLIFDCVRDVQSACEEKAHK